MTCPCCGASIETSQERHQSRLMARGCCVTCGQPKAAGDDHHQCRACRIKRAERERLRYLRRTRADIPEQPR